MANKNLNTLNVKTLLTKAVQELTAKLAAMEARLTAAGL